MSCIKIPHILMPNKSVDLSKWAVIACDQYTSQPAYWKQTDETVGDAPSTLRITLPEVYLEESGVEERTTAIHKTMQRYLTDGTLTELPSGVILTERWSGGNCPRRGIVLAVDLEAYDYKAGSQSPIRPTEKTVEDRIPPRLKVRMGASIELPHIMILIDDPDRTVIEPLFNCRDAMKRVYDTDLMQNGGHINGWFIPEGAITEQIERKLDALSDRSVFNRKYGCTDAQALLPFAVGDGNHSMATAKAYWETVKKTLTESEQVDHPARYCLVELVNIHDESLIIEPIHRVAFHVNAEELCAAALSFFQDNGCEAALNADGDHVFPFCTASGEGVLSVKQPKWAIPLATLQAFLDDYATSHPDMKLDYIHGEEAVRELGTQADTIGFFLPDIQKNDLFRGVVFDGVLPRKTFSMGEAHEKRYYMECKRILR